jgi:hypothetical protein
MMPDLGPKLRRYIDDQTPPIEIDELSPASGRRRARSRWPFAAVAAAFALTAVLAILATEPRGSESDTVVGVAPDTSRPVPAAPADEWAWLDRLGTESPSPPTPAGWKTLDFDDFRFSVPDNWAVPLSRQCAAGEAAGLVLVSTGEASRACGSDDDPAESVFRIEPTAGPTEGTRTDIGTLTATRVVPQDCGDCPDVYRFDNGMQISAGGPEADVVLATLTDSGARRVLQRGPEADTGEWTPVTYGGIEFLAPATWGVVDLPGSYREQTDADGNTTGLSGRLNPGQCGGALFGSGEVSLGVSPIRPRCMPPIEADLRPGDGVWVRPLPDEGADSLGPMIARGEIDSLAVSVVDVNRGLSAPVLDLVIGTGDESIWMTLGIGPDTSTARSILRSLQRAAADESVPDDPSTPFATSFSLFDDPTAPTPADLDLLDRRVIEIAAADPVLREIAGDPPWTPSEVRPVFWNDASLPQGVVLIGGSFELTVAVADYEGPWPSAGCESGVLRGSVFDARVQNLSRIGVTVDLNFERVTRLSAGGPPNPSDPPEASPSIRFGAELEPQAWYSGSCEPYSD